jgi:type IV pilus assembly protein PilV
MALRALLPAPRRVQGVSIIEVMVAVLVLSVGLLGMGSLLAVSLRNTQSASYRTQAANVAYEYVDLMRSYTARGSNSKVGILSQGNFSAPACDIAAAPGYSCGSGSDALNCDDRRIAERACRALPDGRVRARLAPIGPAAARRLTLVVDVCWNDDRSQEPVRSAGCTDPSETLFTLNTEL